jgi:hypothetical protein
MCRSHVNCFHGKEIKPEFQRPTYQTSRRCRDWRSRRQHSRRARGRNRRRSRGSRDGSSRRAGQTRGANGSCGCREVCRKAGGQGSCRQGGQVAHGQSRSLEEDRENHSQEDFRKEDYRQENRSEKTGGEEVTVKTGREVPVRKEVGPPIVDCFAGHFNPTPFRAGGCLVPGRSAGRCLCQRVDHPVAGAEAARTGGGAVSPPVFRSDGAVNQYG